MERYSIPIIGIIGLAVLCTYSWWYYFTVTFFLGIMLYICFIFASDGDVLLMMYEKFGQKPDVFKDKVVWITGASSGIGECLAVALAQTGAKLILSSRREKELERVKERCLKESNVQSDDVLVVVLDANKFDTHRECAEKAFQHFGKIDVLINNSGVSQRAGIHTTTIEADQFVLRTNLLGAISVTKCILPYMVEQNSGHIINVSSVAGKLSSPCSATYSASKFGMIGYFDTVRAEVYNSNIAVTNICPGPVVSNIAENAIQETLDKKDPVKNYDGQAERGWNLLQTGERCAELILIAAANKLKEVWISRPPLLIVVYMSQYMPTCFRFLSARLGMKKAKAFKMSQSTE
ncbi:dehydrogenase/reductase SDR family member 7-like isoform X2 [Apostichopus japonicus]|uniref:dehydrogenase/reductase SDR family member 7-like isoform X2 n=1 Tax=Stichopus japonicus TaxID=307972 RepID=UPI003AB7AFF9